MAGTYIRHLSDCTKDPNQPSEALVGPQAVSDITYEVYNNDYLRHNNEGNAGVMPDLLYGWNSDYVRVKLDLSEVTDLSKQFVLQSLYEKRNVNNEKVPSEPYVHTDSKSKIYDTGSLFVIDETGVQKVPTAGLFLADESDRDNVIMAESDLYRIVLEDNTTVNIIMDELKPLVTSEQDEKMITETDEFIIIQ